MKKSLFGLLCLVGTLGLTGLTSCGEISTSSSTSTSTSTDQKVQLGEVAEPELVDTTGRAKYKSGTYKYDVTYGTSTSTYGVTAEVSVNAEEKIIGVNYKHVTGAHNITPTWSVTQESANKIKADYNKASQTITNLVKGKTIEEATTFVSVVVPADLTNAANISNDGVAAILGEINKEANAQYNVVAGATQTSARLWGSLKVALGSAWIVPMGEVAAPDAVDTTGQAKELFAEYQYTSKWGAKYGVKATVALDDANNILAVNYTHIEGVHNITATWNVAQDKADQIKAEYKVVSQKITDLVKGKSVAEALTFVTTVVADDKEEASEANVEAILGAIKAEGNTQYNVVTGATQTSARLWASLKAALRTYTETPVNPDTPTE